MELLKQGLRWRVGNGSDIRVFIDPWVPDVEGFRVSYKDGMNMSMLVSELITANGEWNMNRLEQVGSVQEVEAILGLPIVHNGGCDKLIWNQNKHGTYSVKSGYWLALKERRERRGVQGAIPAPTDYWRHLWKLKIPPKMSHFLWRCSTGYMPCKSALFLRRIITDPTCSRCQQSSETPLHATGLCPVSVAVLEKASFYTKLSQGTWDNFSSFLEDAMRQLTVDEIKLLVVLLWCNWKERNAVQFGEVARPAQVIYDIGASIWGGIIQESNHNYGQLGMHANDVEDRGRWVPPMHGSLKLNCDASVMANGGQVGIGWICRNSEGRLVEAMGERILGRLKPRAAELLCVLKGLEWAVMRGWSDLRVETDCLEAVRLVNGCEECLADEGLIVERIRMLLGALEIQGIHHVVRVANMAAHEVAGFVARGNGRYSWLGVGPSWLMDVIDNDGPITSSVRREESGEFLSTTGHSRSL
ncbi:putative ribonuclease H-like domain, reverse transcriptase zinc-binding domain-containing protein [Rosa chinensis]|uniref:Putative ribonuclease H-like domain, reverse transcriptase zinc-binding domain-containing protein n=1 Tax=Rosa chinensis TaxID=74649 RepID=A0A2P6QSB8_ROSCH|nr:putative ribonuclease H-like domain, reverse transcriptase zinc-binding domain-containing protein [Rosa chinensis]